jgi:hypothetical protein
MLNQDPGVQYENAGLQMTEVLPNMNALELSIHADATNGEEIAEIGRELQAWISRTVPGCQAEPVRSTARPGSKALDLGFLGPLSLVFLQSGALRELVNCLATFLKERHRKVSFSIKAPDGKEITMEVDNLGRSEIESLVRQLGDLAGAPAAAKGD